MSSQFGLLAKRRFGPFFSTQFLGAFNDNLFKNALIVLLTFHATQWTTLKPELLANLAAGIFILPFFLFSASAGQLADKYDKATLARLVKVLEIGIMLIAALGFYLHHLYLLLSSLFLFGLHSTLFGPVKYAIMPQHLHPDELVGGNALIEAGTFVAILLGTLCGGILAGMDQGTVWITAACLLTAVLGYLSSRSIPSAPAPAPDLRINFNPISATWHNLRFASHDRTVFLSIMGISWFWLYGALLLTQFPVYARQVLGGNESSVTLLLSVFTLGIGIGSLLCEKLSAKSVEIGLVPLGAIGLTLFGLDLSWASPTHAPHSAPLALSALLAAHGTWHVLFDLLLIGLFGGFFIVPLYALLQVRSDVAHRARIIAANNIMNALFMVVGAGAAAGLLSNGLTIPELFGVAALSNAVVALYIFNLVPEFFIRFIAWLLVHSIYRLDKQHAERIPESGAALLVCNHISVLDTLIISAASPRPIRFVLSPAQFQRPWLGFWLRKSGAIALYHNGSDLALGASSLDQIHGALAAGELVAVFPEGNMTATGTLQAFRLAIENIVMPPNSPVIPMALNGLWESVFAAKGKQAGRTRTCKLWRSVTLAIGETQTGSINSDALHHQVAALLSQLSAPTKL